MRKTKLALAVIAVAFCFTGCGEKDPSQIIDGGITKNDGTIVSTEAATQILTPPEPFPEEPALLQDAESKQKRANDVTTAQKIGAAVEAALANEEVFNSIQGMEARFFSIVEPKATNGDESPSIAYSFVDRDMMEGLQLLTDEVGKNLGQSCAMPEYHDDNWWPTEWQVCVKTDNSVEVSLSDSKDNIKRMYPVADPAYQ